MKTTCVCGDNEKCDGEYEYMLHMSNMTYYKFEILPDILRNMKLDKEFAYEELCETKFLKQFYHKQRYICKSKSRSHSSIKSKML